MTLEMFSQEAATRALVREERKEERQETRAEDIRIMVEMLRTMNCGDDSICEKIVKYYDLSEDEARAYLEESNSGSNLDSAEDEFDKQLKDLENILSN